MHDLFQSIYIKENYANIDMNDNPHIHDNVNHDEFENDSMYEAANTPLYNGAFISKLEALLLIMNIKSKNGWINTSVDDILKYVLF